MPIGPLLILSGPSGVGKSTVLTRLLAGSPRPMRLSVSVTTRRPRPGEVDGKDYHFRTPEWFVAARDAGQFLEWAQVHGNYYGTLDSEVTPYRRSGHGVWLDIDVQGCQQVRQRCPDAVSIFLRTSTVAELERRLRARQTESEDAIQRRLAAAQAELARAPEYDHCVANDDLDAAVAAIKAIIEPLFPSEVSAQCTMS
jgi:guanylate kinase